MGATRIMWRLVAFCCIALLSSVSVSHGAVNVSDVGEWRNFLWILKCPNVATARPTLVDDIVSLIASKRFSQIKAVGTGMSYSRWACPAASTDANKTRLMLDMQGFNKIVRLDNASNSVLVEAGVRLGDLSRFLYTKGLTLKTAPWQVNVTVAGALATATHGSSVVYGTFSSTVLGVEAVLANGTVRYFSDDAVTKAAKKRHSNSSSGAAAYMSAFRASLGRLGIVTKVNISLEPDYPVRRSSSFMPLDSFVTDYIPALADAKPKRLQDFEGDNFFFAPYVNNTAVMRVRNTREDTPEARLQAAAYPAFFNATRFNTLPAFIPANIQAIMMNATLMSAVRNFNRTTMQLIFKYFVDETTTDPDLRWASVGQIAPYQATLASRTVLPLRPGVGGLKLDVYEVAVAIEDAPACVNSLRGLFASDPTFADSLYAFIQFRFVRDSRPVLLGPARGKMAMYVNLDAYWVEGDYGGRQYYMQWNRIIDVMTGPVCNGVLHWGLNGPWALYSRGAAQKQLGKELRQFASIAKELDPKGLFATELDSLFFSKK